jgi:hypothetical protein
MSCVLSFQTHPDVGKFSVSFRADGFSHAHEVRAEWHCHTSRKVIAFNTARVRSLVPSLPRISET